MEDQNISEVFLLKKNAKNWCEECNDFKRTKKHQNHMEKKHNTRRKVLGLCLVKGCEEPLKSNCKMCQKHLIKNKLSRRNLANERSVRQICTKCNDEPLVSEKLGSNCLIKSAAKQHLGSAKFAPQLTQMFFNQNKECKYCGILLEIGRNATVGHLKAITRTSLYNILFKEDNPSKKDLKKLISKIRYKLAKETKIEDLNWICQECNNMQGQDSVDEFKFRCCHMYDSNIDRADLEIDGYALKWIKIARYLKLRP